MDIKKNVFKYISILLCFSFISDQWVLGGQIQKNSPSFPEHQGIQITIPAPIGTLNKLFEGRLKRSHPLILIRDVHANPEVQSNISKIIRTLYTQNNVHKIFLEGADGRIDTSFIDQLADEDIRRQIAVDYIGKGVLTGAEALKIESGNKLALTLWGVENSPLYVANLNAFKRTWLSGEKARYLIENLEIHLESYSKTIFCEPFKKWLKLQTSFEQGNIKLATYWKTLKKWAKRNQQEWKSNKSLSLLNQFLTEEEQFKPDQLQQEHSELVLRLSGKASKGQLKKIIQKTLLMRLGNVDPADYYSWLQKISGDELQAFPNLRRFIQHFKSKLDIDSVILNLEFFSKELGNSYLKTEEEKSLYKAWKDLQHLKNLLRLQAHRDEMNFILESPFHFRHWIFSLQSLIAQKENLPISEDEIRTIEASLDNAYDYYRNALARDQVLIFNTLLQLKEDESGILVTGGFHTEGIEKILQKEGISYGVITPKMTGEDHASVYYHLMSDSRLILEPRFPLQDHLALKVLSGIIHGLQDSRHLKREIGSDALTSLVKKVQAQEKSLRNIDEWLAAIQKHWNPHNVLDPQTVRKILLNVLSENLELSIKEKRLLDRYLHQAVQDQDHLTVRVLQEMLGPHTQPSRSQIHLSSSRAFLLIVQLTIHQWWQKLSQFIIGPQRVILRIGGAISITALVAACATHFITAIGYDDKNAPLKNQIIQLVEETIHLLPERHQKVISGVIIRNESMLPHEDYPDSGVPAFYTSGSGKINIAAARIPKIGTIYHEAGHAVWYRLLNDAQRKRFIKLHEQGLSDPKHYVSDYAKKNEKEDFADTYEKYCTDTLKFLQFASQSPILTDKAILIARLFMFQKEGKTFFRFYKDFKPFDFEIPADGRILQNIRTLRTAILSHFPEIEKPTSVDQPSSLDGGSMDAEPSIDASADAANIDGGKNVAEPGISEMKTIHKDILQAIQNGQAIAITQEILEQDLSNLTPHALAHILTSHIDGITPSAINDLAKSLAQPQNREKIFSAIQVLQKILQDRHGNEMLKTRRYLILLTDAGNFSDGKILSHAGFRQKTYGTGSQGSVYFHLKTLLAGTRNPVGFQTLLNHENADLERGFHKYQNRDEQIIIRNFWREAFPRRNFNFWVLNRPILKLIKSFAAVIVTGLIFTCSPALIIQWPAIPPEYQTQFTFEDRKLINFEAEHYPKDKSELRDQVITKLVNSIRRLPKNHQASIAGVVIHNQKSLSHASNSNGVPAYFEPGTGKIQIAADRMPVEGIIYHETGHAVYYRVLTEAERNTFKSLSDKSGKDEKKDLVNYASKYAMTDDREDFAEIYLNWTKDSAGFLPQTEKSKILEQKTLFVVRHFVFKKDGKIYLKVFKGDFEPIDIEINSNEARILDKTILMSILKREPPSPSSSLSDAGLPDADVSTGETDSSSSDSGLIGKWEASVKALPTPHDPNLVLDLKGIHSNSGLAQKGISVSTKLLTQAERIDILQEINIKLLPKANAISHEGMKKDTLAILHHLRNHLDKIRLLNDDADIQGFGNKDIIAVNESLFRSEVGLAALFHEAGHGYFDANPGAFKPDPQSPLRNSVHQYLRGLGHKEREKNNNSGSTRQYKTMNRLMPVSTIETQSIIVNKPKNSLFLVSSPDKKGLQDELFGEDNLKLTYEIKKLFARINGVTDIQNEKPSEKSLLPAVIDYHQHLFFPDTAYSYGPPLVHLQYILRRLRTHLDPDSIFIFLAEGAGLLSRSVLAQIEAGHYSKADLRGFLSGLNSIINSIHLNGLDEFSAFKKLNEALSFPIVRDLQTASTGSPQDRLSFFIYRLGWNLIFVAGRPIFVTPQEAQAYYSKPYQLSKDRLQALLVSGINLSQPRSMTRSKSRKNDFGDGTDMRNDETPYANELNVKSPVTALCIPLANAMGSLVIHPSDFYDRLTGNADKQKMRETLLAPLASRVKSLAQSGKFDEAKLLIQSDRSLDESLWTLNHLLRDADLSPSIFELIAQLNTRLAAHALLNTVQKNGTLDSDRLETLIFILALIQPERFYGEHKGALRSALPASCFILAYMMKEPLFQPLVASLQKLIEQGNNSDPLLYERLPGLDSVKKIFDIIEAYSINRLVKEDTSTNTFEKNVREIDLIMEGLKRDYFKIRTLPPDEKIETLKYLSDFCILGRSPTNVLEALKRFAEASGQDISQKILIELLRFQTPETLAAFIHVLNQEQSLPLIKRDISSLRSLKPILNYTQYDLADPDSRIEYLSMILASIARDTEPAATDDEPLIPPRLELSAGAVHYLLTHKTFTRQGSLDLTHQIMLNPAVDALDGIQEIQQWLRDHLQGYNTLEKFHLTGLLRIEDMKGSHRMQAIAQCITILNLHERDMNPRNAQSRKRLTELGLFNPLIDPDLATPATRKIELEQKQRNALQMLGELQAYEQIDFLLKLIADSYLLKLYLLNVVSIGGRVFTRFPRTSRLFLMHEGRYRREAIAVIALLAKQCPILSFSDKQISFLMWIGGVGHALPDLLLNEEDRLEIRKVIGILGRKGYRSVNDKINHTFKVSYALNSDPMRGKETEVEEDFYSSFELVKLCFNRDLPSWKNLLSRLVNGLRTNNLREQTMLIHILNELGIDDDITYNLIQIFFSKDWNLKVIAALHLGWVDDPGHVLELLETSSKDEPALIYLFKKIRHFRRVYINGEFVSKDAYFKVLGKKPFNRWTIIQNLSHGKDPKAVGILLAALRDPVTGVQQAAMNALLRMGPAALEKLEKAVRQPDNYDIKFKLMTAIGMIQNAETQPQSSEQQFLVDLGKILFSFGIPFSDEIKKSIETILTHKNHEINIRNLRNEILTQGAVSDEDLQLIWHITRLVEETLQGQEEEKYRIAVGIALVIIQQKNTMRPHRLNSGELQSQKFNEHLKDYLTNKFAMTGGGLTALILNHLELIPEEEFSITNFFGVKYPQIKGLSTISFDDQRQSLTLVDQAA